MTGNQHAEQRLGRPTPRPPPVWNKKGEKSRRVPITAQIAIRKGAKRNYATSGNGSRRTVLDLCEYNLIPNEIRLSHSTRSNLLLLGDVEKGKSTSASGGREESNGITPPSSERKCLSVVLGSIFNKRSVVFCPNRRLLFERPGGLQNTHKTDILKSTEVSLIGSLRPNDSLFWH